MNYLDLAILAVIVLCALIGLKRGLIRTVYGLVSFFAAIILANILRHPVSRAMRESALYDFLRGWIDGGLSDAEQAADLPVALPPTEIPAEFLTNLAINAIAVVAVFFIVFVVLTIVGAVLDIVSKLPVINTLNNLGGLIAGIVFGAGVSWLALILMSIFAGNPDVQGLLAGSHVARAVLGF